MFKLAKLAEGLFFGDSESLQSLEDAKAKGQCPRSEIGFTSLAESVPILSHGWFTR